MPLGTNQFGTNDQMTNHPRIPLPHARQNAPQQLSSQGHATGSQAALHLKPSAAEAHRLVKRTDFIKNN